MLQKSNDHLYTLGWRNTPHGWPTPSVRKERCVCTVLCFPNQFDKVFKELLYFDPLASIDNSMTKLMLICLHNGIETLQKTQAILYAFATNRRKTFLAKLTLVTELPLNVIERNCSHSLKEFCSAECMTLL